MSSTFSSRPLFPNLPPPAECLAILFACTQLTVFGLGGLANPIDWSKGYGLPIDAAAEAEKTQIALVSALATRNIRHAALILALACYARDRRAVGLALAVNCISSLADTCIVRWFGTAQQVSLHVGGLLSSAGLSMVLLKWGRDDAWW
ncbi:hypothetical protein BDY17DRAFT_251934 [Neohortaea acidophila]|uniref:DUF4267 domain-containing protein n=1 Tax=Neohortaea acidophila TaxID=245834 RepID=A0A6A6PS67_9PEZI|nr:uncharacterized protein BDY17DRAFT_251934 [Neohortaea acidophila]KAF2482725.1 hypothetical protein BDY17DRAFT_251934 [Neohortaea acidophila]